MEHLINRKLYVYQDINRQAQNGDCFLYNADVSQAVDFRAMTADITLTIPAIALVANMSHAVYKPTPSSIAQSFQNAQTNQLFTIGGYPMMDPNTSYCQPKYFIQENQPQTVQAAFQQIQFASNTAIDGGAGQPATDLLETPLQAIYIKSGYAKSYDPKNLAYTSAAGAATPAQAFKINNINLGFIFGGLFKSGFCRSKIFNQDMLKYFIVNQTITAKFKNQFSFDVWYPYADSNATGVSVTFNYVKASVTINKMNFPRANVTQIVQRESLMQAAIPKYFDQIKQEGPIRRSPSTDGTLELEFLCTAFVGHMFSIRKYILQGLLQNCYKYNVHFNSVPKILEGYNFFDDQQFSVDSDPNFKCVTFFPDADVTQSFTNTIQFKLFFKNPDGTIPNLTADADVAKTFGNGLTAAQLQNGTDVLYFACYSVQQWSVYNNENLSLIQNLMQETEQAIAQRILVYSRNNYAPQINAN